MQLLTSGPAGDYLHEQISADMDLDDGAVILRFNADLDTALRLSREDFGRQAGASLEQSPSPVAESAFGARTIAIPSQLSLALHSSRLSPLIPLPGMHPYASLCMPQGYA